MEKNCVICKKITDSDTSAVLTIGAVGNAKYICDECEADIDVATTSRSYDEIIAAMDRVSAKLSKANVDDEQVLDTVDALFVDAASRASAIKDGTYDFSLDDKESDKEEFDITEEYEETEEDKSLDEADKKKNKVFDAVSTWICFALLILAFGFLVYRFIDAFI